MTNDADYERLAKQSDRRAEIDRKLGAALDPILAPIARERRAQARRRIVELIDGVVENQRPATPGPLQNEARG